MATLTERPGTQGEAKKPGLKLGNTFSSFKIYNFRLNWTGQLISQMGTWMQTVGQAWLVLQLTNSPVALATVTALGTLPVLCSTLFAGVLADRFNKRKLLMTTNCIYLVQSSTLAILTLSGHIQLWEIYLLAFIMGCISALDQPSRQSFGMELVGRENIVNAVGLQSAQFNGARLLGPAVAGVLIANWGVAICFSLNAVSYVAALAALLLMRTDQFYSVPAKRAGIRMIGDLVEGIKFLWHTPSLMVIVIVLGGIGTFGYNTGTVIPLLAEDFLHSGSTGYGFLLGSLGAGAVLAGLGMAFLGRSSHGLLLRAGGAYCVMYLAVAFTPWFPVAVVLWVALGAAIQALMSSGNTLLQLGTPDHLRGRVMSVYGLLMFGSTPIGAVFTGVLAQSIGISLTVAIEAALCLTAFGSGLLYYLHKSGTHTAPMRTPLGGSG